ncbi:hypothetical protein [Microbispora bryophytorum]|uniref:hypothetical protein n=1 Tax=Microbispora bryophytorum TaxID=1460882 RepID=UPI001157E0ED|nr:hypothetical protein [Microbispora bryophytorum]MBD3138713.1 hypothetical protein [Microbispora bryophytorum]TQS03732.1 hypothetical protein FLX07_24095 [Microbispora bryophytorum]
MLHSCGASRRVPPFAVVLVLVLVAVAAAAAQVLLTAPAHARAGRGDGDGPASVGNGTRNRNIVYLRSPTRNRGHQHTAASTAGGATSVADGFCRRTSHCDIRQNIAVAVAAPL